MIDLGRPGEDPATVSRVPRRWSATQRAKGQAGKMNLDEHPAMAGQRGIQSDPAVIAFRNGQPADASWGPAEGRSRLNRAPTKEQDSRRGAGPASRPGRSGEKRDAAGARRSRRGGSWPRSRQGVPAMAGSRAPISRDASSKQASRRLRWYREAKRNDDGGGGGAAADRVRAGRGGWVRSPSGARRSPPIARPHGASTSRRAQRPRASEGAGARH